MSMDITPLYVCSDFLPRVRSEVCHICLQPESLHPTDADRSYWARWLIDEVLLELYPWSDGRDADRRPV